MKRDECTYHTGNVFCRDCGKRLKPKFNSKQKELLKTIISLIFAILGLIGIIMFLGIVFIFAVMEVL